MRITVNGARVETNISKSIEPVSWNQAKECARGKSRKSTELNNYIEKSRIKLHRIYTQLEENGELITARILQEKFFGVDKKVEQVRTIIGTMREPNEQCRAFVGKDFALITVRRYESCTRYFAELIKLKYDKEDLPITEVNGELVRAFEFYLKTEKNCPQNTVIRYMKCLKKIINLALANEWIEKNPFAGIKQSKLYLFKNNPEEFIRKVISIIKEQKSTMIVEAIHYNITEGKYDSDIFTMKSKMDFDRAYEAKKHITDYVFSDSKGKRQFAHDLDEASEVVVYAKLPRTFQIPTPVGNYAPDWAIAMKKNDVRHIFFIAETKGSMSSMDLSAIERAKIDCAEKLFNSISNANVKYHKVATYQDLIDGMNAIG